MNDLGILWPLSGGLLIGLAAAGYLLLNGRIAGISGQLAAALGLQAGANQRLGLAFISGLLLGSAAAIAWIRQPQILIEASTPLLVVAGLLVGFGTRWGNGCTSGHGVCGLARLSPRSLVATLVFMGVAAAVVFVLRHLLAAQP
jgi:uncharacterized membrane protein YedE/YeeE